MKCTTSFSRDCMAGCRTHFAYWVLPGVATAKANDGPILLALGLLLLRLDYPALCSHSIPFLLLDIPEYNWRGQ
jgi:hypothetical protein